MDKSKETERFIQRGEGVEITNIPPENLAFIRKQREAAAQQKQDKPQEQDEQKPE